MKYSFHRINQQSYCWVLILTFILSLFGAISQLNAADLLNKPEQPHITRLENGMELVLIPNHSVKMIAANIIIKVGSRDEDWETWGAAHFLEHLLFNGTENRTQAEIYAEFDRLGAYHNAHTGSHYTDFMLLAASSKFLPALSIMTDMIFASTLPRWKFEKERGIVMEEIARSNPDRYRPSQEFNEKLFANTALSRSVLGTVKSIDNLERSKVLDFYHSWYNPNNMLLFVTGDFDPDTMITKLSEIVSIYSPQDLPPRKYIKEPDFSSYAKQYLHRVSSKIKRKSIIIGQATPLTTHPDFASILFLRDLLEKRMESSFPAGINGSTELTFDHDLCILKTVISFPDSIKSETVIDKFDSIIATMASKPFKQSEIDQLANNFRADEIFTSEKLHYYGVMNSPYWALVPFEEFKSWPSRMSEFTPRYLKDKTIQWLQTDDRLIMTFSPSSKGGEGEDLASSTNNTEIQRFDSPDYPLLLTRTDNTARVFAMHILFRDRWLWDQKYGIGSVDILHRLMKKGKDRKGRSISDRLGKISGSLKTFDSAFIPYDDYYTSPEYSFLRFETLPEHWEAGIDLVFELFAQIPTDQSNLTEAKQAMESAHNKSIHNPIKAGRKLLRDGVIPQSAISEDVYCTDNEINSTQLASLISEFFSPENMIISISSSINPAEIVTQIHAAYIRSKLINNSYIGNLNSDKTWITPSPTVEKIDTLWLNLSQGAIVMGKVIPVIESSERLPLVIANAYLNERLAMVLREQQGLAYSLGSRIIYRNGNDESVWAYWEISVGTRQENLDKVKAGISKIINDFRAERIKFDTIERLSASIAGRQMMRSMARIGQAYSMGTGEYYWNNPEAGQNISDDLRILNESEVNEVAKKFLTANGFQIIIVE